ASARSPLSSERRSALRSTCSPLGAVARDHPAGEGAVARGAGEAAGRRGRERLVAELERLAPDVEGDGELAAEIERQRVAGRQPRGEADERGRGERDHAGARAQAGAELRAELRDELGGSLLRPAGTELKEVDPHVEDPPRLVRQD